MWSVRLSNAARDSLQTLPEQDREVVLAAIGRLTEGPTPPGLPRPYRLQNRPDLIVLPAGRYRLAYAAADQDQTITVVDMVAHVGATDTPRLTATN